MTGLGFVGISSQLNFIGSTVGLWCYEVIIYICFKARLFPEYFGSFSIK